MNPFSGFALVQMKLIHEHWRRHKLRIVGIVLFTAVTVSAAVAIPRIIGYVVDAVKEGLKDPAAFDRQRLVNFALLLVGLEFVRTTAMQFLQFTRGMNNEYFLWQMRTSIYRRVLDKGHRFTNQYPSGDVIERLDQDLDHLSFFSCSSLFMPVQAGMTLIAALFVLLKMNWQLTILTVVPLTITLVIFLRFGPLVRKSWREVRERIADTYRYLESAFSGISLVKSYTMEERSATAFRALLDRRVKTTVKAVRIQVLIQTLVREGVFQVGTLLIISAGGLMVINQRLSLGELIAFNSYLMMLIFPMMMISFFFINLKQAQVEEERIRTMRDFPHDVDTTTGTRPAPREAAIRLEHVSFDYGSPPPGRRKGEPEGKAEPIHPALTDISMVLAPGTRVGIAGTVGSGKSTLMRLLLRVAEPTAGRVTIGGVPLGEFEIKSLHSRFGLAPQEANLFSDTVLNNIRMGRQPEDGDREKTRMDANEAGAESPDTRNASRITHNGDSSRAREVARIAQLESELTEMPKGLDELIGERGLKLSGGQRGRVSIARALYTRPAVVLLDDVTASLDAETEQQFIKDVLEYMKGATLVIVSHRLSILAECDLVYVMDQGRIVESGTHSELLARPGLYRKLYERQLLEEDGANG